MRLRILAAVVLLGVSLGLKAGVAEMAFPCPEGYEDREHEPIERGQPAWPHAARMMCLEGSVVVEFTVGANGWVRDAEVIHSEPPGLFDRAVLAAVGKWAYMPRCEGGYTVDAEQRTAIDFVFEAEYREECLLGAEQLTGEALELASALGLLYSMLAEWYLAPWQSDWPARIQAALVREFEGDLGRVERFHHQVIAERVAWYQDWLRDPPLHLYQAMFGGGLAHLGTDRSFGEALDAVRAGAVSHFESTQALRAEQAQALLELKLETELDPDLLDVVVQPFLGDLLAQDYNDFQRQYLDATLAVVDMLQDPMFEWVLEPHGPVLENPADQARYFEVFGQWWRLHHNAREDARMAWLGLMDYRQ